MALKRPVFSPKIYLIMLIIAMALLMFIGSISYKQIDRLGKSAATVNHIMEVGIHINQLFSYYSQMQAAELKNRLLQDSINISTYEAFMPEAREAFNKLEQLIGKKPEQQQTMAQVKFWQDSLFHYLGEVSEINYKNPKQYTQEDEKTIRKVSATITQLNLLRNQIYRVEQAELSKRRQEYASQISFTPLTTLFLGMFALFIFVISFLQIEILRNRTAKAEKFLQKVLASTDNIIGYFTPIYNNEGEIKDFIIDFTNQRIEPILNMSPKQIAQSRMSELIPINFENGIFEELKAVIKSSTHRKFEKRLEFNGQKLWFSTTATPMGIGVLTTSINTTAEKKASKNLKNLNEQLAIHNSNLIQTKAFLNNILESTSNTVSHLKTERDAQGNIIDFIYLFANKEIESLTGMSVSAVLGKSITEVFPFIHENGLYDLLIKCANNGTIEIHEAQNVLKGKSVWIHSTINKLNNGITVTSYDTTDIVLSKLSLLKLNEQLLFQNSILKDAEAVAKIGSYRWDFQSNKTILSDNFYRLLDCEVGEFIASPENYRAFVHPADLPFYEENMRSSLIHKKVNKFTYRIIDKSKTIKYFQHSGHVVQNEFQGVVKDITKELRNEQSLKDKNMELMHFNNELESFNQVVSHDLQEPLRKIQIFISRIMEGDLENVSEKNIDYLGKINSSANRMQILIKNLLAYSRLNKEKKEFSTVDLKEILEKVREDFEAPIKEKNVLLSIEDLPKLQAVPFQMEQLFINLVSNSIKYASVIERPKITISCKKMRRKEISEAFNKKAPFYYCISFKDNGIGFDPTNSKKIFGLFQRLHQKEEYSGTGIGLAICKKIVDNHHGHITADSMVNKGSTFKIYLPI